jgi:LPS export ABC transporter protein LptC
MAISGRDVLACALLLLAAAPAGSAPEAPETPPQPLVLHGITYVASDEERNELVLEAAIAHVHLDAQRIDLEGVHVKMGSKAPGGVKGGGVDVECDRGTFDLETRDFDAAGNVRGVTADGRRFRTEALHYRADRQLVTTNSRVVIRDDAGTYQGGGFDYWVREDRFRLRGGASVVGS